MVDKKTSVDYKNKILQIYENEKPLTQLQTVRIMAGLKDEDIRETANSSFRGGNTIPTYCDNPKHDHYKKCVGGGVCLAKKYKRLDVLPDLVCQGCRSKVIIQTLNYIFDTYYDGKYKAEWRASRRAPKPIKEKKPRIKKNREDFQEILQSMPVTEAAPKKKRGRQKGSKNKPKVIIEPIVQAPEKKVRTKKTEVVKPVPIVPEKKKRGRPKGSKNKTITDTPIKIIEPEPMQKKVRGRPRKMPLIATAA